MDIIPVEKFFRGVAVTSGLTVLMVGGLFCFKVVKMPKHNAISHTTPAPVPSFSDIASEGAHQVRITSKDSSFTTASEDTQQ